MGIWESFIGFIIQAIEMVTLTIGVNEAIAIMLVTVLLRLLLVPISTLAMITMARNKKAISALKPQIEALNKSYKENPTELAKRTMQLYQKHNIKLFDKTNMMNMFSQGITGFGMFQAIQGLALNSKILWIASIAKPDVLLALIVGVITYASMVLMPGSAEQVNQLMFIIPAAISVLVLISFPSALGLYMAISALINLVQSLGVSQYLRLNEHKSLKV